MGSTVNKENAGNKPRSAPKRRSFKHDAFISYSSENKPAADAICAILEQRGIRCWIAPRDIRPGSEWAAEIIDAVACARVFVLVFSKFANNSKQVVREVEAAANREIPVLPFRIDKTMPSKGLEYYISGKHWLDAVKPPLVHHAHRLADVIDRIKASSDSFNEVASAGLREEFIESSKGPLTTLWLSVFFLLLLGWGLFSGATHLFKSEVPKNNLPEPVSTAEMPLIGRRPITPDIESPPDGGVTFAASPEGQLRPQVDRGQAENPSPDQRDAAAAQYDAPERSVTTLPLRQFVWLKQPTAAQIMEAAPRESLESGQVWSATLDCVVADDGGLRRCRVITQTLAPASGAAAMRLTPYFQVSHLDGQGLETRGRNIRFRISFSSS